MHRPAAALLFLPLLLTGCTNIPGPPADGTALTETVLSTSATTLLYGANVTLTAQLFSGGGTPSGSVTFYSGSPLEGTGVTSLGTATVNSAGVATLTTTALPAGTDWLTASYGATTNFAASTSTVVSATVGYPTATALTSSAPSSVYGNSITLKATVSSTFGIPPGTVTFYSGNASLGSTTLNSSSVATLATTALQGGTDSVTATYATSTYFATSTSPAVNVSVSPASTATALASSATSTFAGLPLTLTATVTSPGGTPSGAVSFYSGGALLAGSPVAFTGGVAQLTTTALTQGTDSLTATYQASQDFATSTSPALSETVLATPPPLAPAPCDIMAAATPSTPCQAAYSVTRRLFAAYAGPLFELYCPSCNPTLMNIGTVPGAISGLVGGEVNIPAANAYCSQAPNACFIYQLYDQTGSGVSQIGNTGVGNNLAADLPTTSGGTITGIIQMAPYQLAPVDGLPIVQNAQYLIGNAFSTGGKSTAHYRKRTQTVNIPQGNSPISVYYVRYNYWLGVSDGDFGDMEATVSDTGIGHMFALGYSNWGEGGSTANSGENGGYGPYYCVDRENGLDCGPQTSSASGGTNPPVSSGTTPRPSPPLFTEIAKYTPNNGGVETIEMADATGQTTPLTTVYNTVPGYPVSSGFPFALEGGLSMCEGGDGTIGYCAFQEGAVLNTTTSSATDAAVQANIASFYSQFPVSSPYQPILSGQYQGPGDLASGATGWWGLRAYNSAYAATLSPSVILQRASDSSTQTINVTATGDFNVSAAQTFCANTTCSIEEWFDQSGAGHNMVQTTAANQAQVVFNCNNMTKVCAYFNGTSDAYSTTYTNPTPQPFTLNAVYQKTNFTDVVGGALISTYPETNGSTNLAEANSAENAQMYSASNSTFSADSYVFISLTGVYNGTASVGYQNGFTNPVSIGASALGTGVWLGSNSNASQYLIGYGDEFAVWPTGLTAAQVAAVQTNQRLYWQF